MSIFCSTLEHNDLVVLKELDSTSTSLGWRRNGRDSKAHCDVQVAGWTKLKCMVSLFDMAKLNKTPVCQDSEQVLLEVTDKLASF